MRYLTADIIKDLNKKMVFIGGPRQVGKTTLAKGILENNFKSGRYFNWDYDDDRIGLRRKEWDKLDELIVFDEIHKMPKWKSWIKGLYDVLGKNHKFLVTGSARLDLYKRGGDSLVGRYHYWRLHPFSFDDYPTEIGKEEVLSRLLNLGGFPEPFFNVDQIQAKRWRRERLDRIIREDIRDLEHIKNIQQMSMVLDLLRERVGRPVSFNSIAEDLQVSPNTIKNWIEIFERMYVLFIIRPYTRKMTRSILKAPKIYFYDNGDVIGDIGSKFENLIAAGLMKKLNFLEDKFGDRYELKYIRDKNTREVDFAIIKNNVLDEIIEVKFNDGDIAPNLSYFSKILAPVRTTQIVSKIYSPKNINGITVTDPFSYFAENSVR